MPELSAPVRTAPALELVELGYRYSGAGHDALRDVSLEIGRGELVVLAGRSASGKSTLLRAGCGLVPHFHGGEISGEVRVAGLDTRRNGPAELAGSVGYVDQDPEAQVVSTTVAAEIELPLELRGEAAASRARAVEEVALALAIPHLLGRTVDTLSGGELQRVALAAALVTRPGLVLLDEPTSQLDPVAGDELIWLLRRLNEEWGIAIVLAEHRLERCLAAADRVVAMEQGTIGFDGRSSDFLAWALDHDAALATPGAHLFSLAGISPLPVGVRAARERLDREPLKADADALPERVVERPETPRRSRSRFMRETPVRGGLGGRLRPKGPGVHASQRAVVAKDLWVELDRGDSLHDVLKGVELEVGRGERVALMGRNGAGKSTLLRAAAGILGPAHGRIEAPGGCALLTQSPGDFLVRERVGEELPGDAGSRALREMGLEHAVDADPRELSGGERQRLALAIALAGRGEGGEPPGLVALDEPTRGMDRGRKDELAALVGRLAGAGAAVIVATHDVEFAARFAERVLLLADGVVIADGPAGEVLSGGWYFATEVARIVGQPGIITPELGAELLRGEP